MSTAAVESVAITKPSVLRETCESLLFLKNAIPHHSESVFIPIKEEFVTALKSRNRRNLPTQTQRDCLLIDISKRIEPFFVNSIKGQNRIERNLNLKRLLFNVKTDLKGIVCSNKIKWIKSKARNMYKEEEEEMDELDEYSPITFLIEMIFFMDEKGCKGCSHVSHRM